MLAFKDLNPLTNEKGKILEKKYQKIIEALHSESSVVTLIRKDGEERYSFLVYQKELAKKLGYSVSSLRKNLQEMYDQNLLTLTRLPSGTNIYSYCIERKNDVA